MYINISDRHIEKIQEFCDNNNYDNFNLAANELIRLGLLAYDMIQKSNITPQITMNRKHLKYDTSPYIPTKFLPSKRFLTQLPSNVLEQIDAFRDVNKLGNRGLALSVLLRLGILRYYDIPASERPSVTIVKPIKSMEKSLILSDDQELFEMLESFQKELHIKQRNITILFLLEIIFDDISKRNE